MEVRCSYVIKVLLGNYSCCRSYGAETYGGQKLKTHTKKRWERLWPPPSDSEQFQNTFTPSISTSCKMILDFASIAPGLPRPHPPVPEPIVLLIRSHHLLQTFTTRIHPELLSHVLIQRPLCVCPAQSRFLEAIVIITTCCFENRSSICVVDVVKDWDCDAEVVD